MACELYLNNTVKNVTDKFNILLSYKKSMFEKP